ncbi:leucyl/phenylalanyl-tRNA--protein transferase [bacterium]|nr:leucyl/phenylalanyl-tRNA--protein transferase [bacterium]
MTTQLPPPLDLLRAYALGYFPMPNPQTDEIEWYQPNPRAILPLDSFHCSRSLQRTLNKNTFTFTLNRDFNAVIAGCAEREETWINEEFIRAYTELHVLGHAHSIEVWQQGLLVGGVYGVQIGGAFFAESMFSRKRDASKAALFYLVKHLNEQQFSLLEVQFLTPHLERLGAKEISIEQYERKLQMAIQHFRRF